jgi:hypothetical protein
MGPTNERQRHFNDWPINELHGKAESIQTSVPRRSCFSLEETTVLLLRERDEDRREVYCLIAHGESHFENIITNTRYTIIN